MTWQKFQELDDDARRADLAHLGQHLLAETAVFQQTCDMLSYHNQLTDLIHLLQAGYGQLLENKPNELLQQTITAQLTDSLIFRFLEQNRPDTATAPASLVDALQAFIPVDAAGLNRYLAHLRGYTQFKWKAEHLAGHPPQNMAALMLEFMAHAREKADVPYGRSQLVRHLLPTYFVERRTGQLNPRQDLGDLMRRGRPLPKQPASDHPLLPDKDTLQRFLAKLLNYNPTRPYAAAALFRLLPGWLTFLEQRQLLTSAEHQAGLADLAALQPDLLAYFANLAGDDELAAAVSAWPPP